MVIPGDFLTKTYLGRCSLDYKKTCSAPGSKFTDFNIWDRAVPLQELMDWTKCKKVTVTNWSKINRHIN